MAECAIERLISISQDALCWGAPPFMQGRACIAERHADAEAGRARHDDRRRGRHAVLGREHAASRCGRGRRRRRPAGPVDAVIAAMAPGSWKELPSTHMADVCPPPDASSTCGAVMLAWSRGAYEGKVFFDGDCPLCRREIAMVKRLDRGGRVVVTDIAKEGFDPTPLGRTHVELMARIHGRREDGTLVEGVDVFRQIYAAIGFGPVVALTRVRPVAWLIDVGYRWFANNRLRLTGRARRRSAGPSSAPARRPGATPRRTRTPASAGEMRRARSPGHHHPSGRSSCSRCGRARGCRTPVAASWS